ncbi:TIGR02757 family protein [Reichenbachiella versicolor]|uniref:TIGR02757 family protein n=1 Tax=Reichenbachiella versicolor TaxID=1821036 RepID=UPI000D6E07D6|nr:TIGR02757 family protein [Reichenbachiella versicolor]
MIDKNIGLKEFLDEKVREFNRPNFIEDDPISIPHRFKRKQDIEIAGFFAAILAWGQRKTIINKCSELMARMDDSPYDFVKHHSENDLKKLEDFKHRTFNDTDLLYFIYFLSRHYQKHNSLEPAFTKGKDAENKLTAFHDYFFEDPYAPNRTRKHIATPERNSACKRINMYLRWMVRKDKFGVDFGIWNTITPNELICPLDIHVSRSGRKLGLISRKQDDWKTAIELTEALKKLDPKDPVQYDFALFGLGVIENF